MFSTVGICSSGVLMAPADFATGAEELLQREGGSATAGLGEDGDVPSI